MESGTRYRLLSFVEKSRDYAKMIETKNNESPFYDSEQHARIFKYKKVLERIEEYVQKSAINDSLDMTNYNQAYTEISEEIKSFYDSQLVTYKNNAETMILEKALIAEKDYIENKKEDKFFSRIEKITNTSKQLNVENLKKISTYFDWKYSQNFKHTGEKLNDDYTQIQLDETNKSKIDDLFENVRVLSEKCNEFSQGTKSVQQEEVDGIILQLMDAVNGEIVSQNYDENYLFKLSSFVEELEAQKINDNINLEDAQKLRDQLIWEMKQAKYEVSKLKNDILVSETIANINKTKEQLSRTKEMGGEVELWYVYSAFIEAHLTGLEETAEQMQYLNKDELMQEIKNIKTENTEFKRAMEQNENKEQ